MLAVLGAGSLGSVVPAAPADAAPFTLSLSLPAQIFAAGAPIVATATANMAASDTSFVDFSVFRGSGCSGDPATYVGVEVSSGSTSTSADIAVLVGEIQGPYSIRARLYDRASNAFVATSVCAGFRVGPTLTMTLTKSQLEPGEPIFVTVVSSVVPSATSFIDYTVFEGSGCTGAELRSFGQEVPTGSNTSFSELAGETGFASGRYSAKARLFDRVSFAFVADSGCADFRVGPILTLTMTRDLFSPGEFVIAEVASNTVPSNGSAVDFAVFNGSG